MHLKKDGVAVYNLADDPGESDNLLENDRFPREEFERMLHSLLLYESELAPGWNILVHPTDGERLRVTVENFEPTVEPTRGVNRTIDFGAFVSHVNVKRIEVEGKPALLQLEPPREQVFKLVIEKYVESTDTWAPVNIPVGVHFGASERQTPTPISLEMIDSRAPSCRERGASEWLRTYPVCVWFSRTSLELSDTRSIEYSEEQSETLRNLGYLQ
jgi:hypothetical protein